MARGELERKHHSIISEMLMQYEEKMDIHKYGVLLNLVDITGKRVIDHVYWQLLFNPYLKYIAFFGDAGVGKSTALNSLAEFLQSGIFETTTKFLLKTFMYDTYSARYLRNVKNPRIEKHRRVLMNKAIIRDFKNEETFEEENAELFLRLGYRIIKLVEAPVKGEESRGKELGFYLNQPVPCRPFNRTFAVYLETESAVPARAMLAREIIMTEPDGHILQAKLQAIRVSIPGFNPDDSGYLFRLKEKISMMAQPHEIAEIRQKSLAEANLNFAKMSIDQIATLVEKMPFLSYFGENEQIDLQRRLTDDYFFMYSTPEEGGLGFDKNSALIGINPEMPDVVYNLGQL